MRVHHLNCGSMRPMGQGLLERINPAAAGAPMVCHCLLIEVGDALVLVDTGFGLEDIAQRHRRLSRAFVTAARPALSRVETAAHQVEALGFHRRDVAHIILTHLDPDHAGGLSDFPHAKVHVLAEEHFGATTRPSARERARYRPAQWDAATQWQLYGVRGEPWFGFDTVRDLRGLPPELLMIPMSGHSRGHVCVAVDTGSGWLLHCGDAYFQHGAVHPGAPCASALTLFERTVAFEYDAVLANQRRLSELARSQSDAVQLFCSHDGHELSRMQALATQAP
jgi:glyoxylase-like metal-dependent hydrolase (beta-lactamase superfamily II)